MIQFGTLIQEFFRDLRMRLLVDEAEGRRAVACHAAIIAALRVHDTQQAQQFMEEHLEVHSRRLVALAAPPETATSHLAEGEQTHDADTTNSSPS